MKNKGNSKDTGKKMHQILVVDANRCTGCEVCESTCSMVHDNEFNPLNARIHRIRIEPILNTTISCVSCYNPSCINACPLGIISKDQETGIIHIDTNKCDGCGACVRACEYGAITIHTKNHHAITCDLCESTEYNGPQCIEYCPKRAIFLQDIDPTIEEERFTTLARIIKEGFPDPPEGEILN